MSLTASTVVGFCVLMSHRSLPIMLAALFVASPVVAQDKADDSEKWNDLQETEDEPDAVEDDVVPQPKATGGNPYRDTIDDEQAVVPVQSSESDRGDDYSESVAWMNNWVPRSRVSHASIEYDVWSTSQGSVMTWDAVVQAGFGDPQAFGAIQIGLPWSYVTPIEEATIANPVVGGHGGGKVHDQVVLWGGMVIAIPTVAAGSTVERKTVVFASLPVRAGVDTHRFASLVVPLRLELGGELQLHPLVYVRAEIDPMLFIPTEGQDVEFVQDQHVDAEVLSPIGLGGGLRLQAALSPTGSGDTVQTGLEPFIAYEPPFAGPYDVPVHARLGLLIALDERLGFGFDSGKVMTLRTMVGARF